jgi:copper oxidase (laccase) domain-containing protein
VVVVTAPGGGAGTSADAAVTTRSGAALAVHTADCVPVVLVAEGGGVGVAHAGWRGLLAGVLPATVERLCGVAGGPVRAWVGPHIGPECYEFGLPELEEVVGVLGPGVAAETRRGRPALDLSAATTASLRLAGVVDPAFVGGCTACGPGWWSHRARGDGSRQAAVAWIEG